MKSSEEKKPSQILRPVAGSIVGAVAGHYIGKGLAKRHMPGYMKIYPGAVRAHHISRGGAVGSQIGVPLGFLAGMASNKQPERKRNLSALVPGMIRLDQGDDVAPSRKIFRHAVIGTLAGAGVGALIGGHLAKGHRPAYHVGAMRGKSPKEVREAFAEALGGGTAHLRRGAQAGAHIGSAAGFLGGTAMGMHAADKDYERRRREFSADAEIAFATVYRPGFVASKPVFANAADELARTRRVWAAARTFPTAAAASVYRKANRIGIGHLGALYPGMIRLERARDPMGQYAPESGGISPQDMTAAYGNPMDRPPSKVIVAGAGGLAGAGAVLGAQKLGKLAKLRKAVPK